MLYEYQKQVQRFLRDQGQQLINPEDIVSYVNRARREVAIRTQCLQVLTPISGGISTIEVTAGGAGYSPTASVSISSPDYPSGMAPYPGGLQAVAEATVDINGVVTDVLVTAGGAGYFQPTVTIVDGTGTGATATIGGTIGYQTIAQQEVYTYSDVDLSAFPGYDKMIDVFSISIIFNNWRYSLPVYSFSVYQAMIRQYPRQYYYVPTVAAKFNRGDSSQLFLYPIASQPYQIELFGIASAQDLTADTSYEAIPAPFRDAVPFLAGHYAFLELQNYNAAAFYDKLYSENIAKYQRFANSRQVSNVYGRWTSAAATIGLAASMLTELIV